MLLYPYAVHKAGQTGMINKKIPRCKVAGGAVRKIDQFLLMFTSTIGRRRVSVNR